MDEARGVVMLTLTCVNEPRGQPASRPASRRLRHHAPPPARWPARCRPVPGSRRGCGGGRGGDRRLEPGRRRRGYVVASRGRPLKFMLAAFLDGLEGKAGGYAHDRWMNRNMLRLIAAPPAASWRPSFCFRSSGARRCCRAGPNRTVSSKPLSIKCQVSSRKVRYGDSP
jgi:hypothetical protein